MAGKVKIVCNPSVFDVRKYPGSSEEEPTAIPACFVAMPFSKRSDRAKRMQGAYKDHIKPAVEQNGLKCVRGDDFPAGGKIMEQIWEAICKAEIIVGDFTTSNPNVIYEVGIAHTLGKPLIGIVQDARKIPFDNLHLRFITYEDTEEGYTELGRKLKEEIGKQRQILKKQKEQYPQKYIEPSASGVSAEDLEKAWRELAEAKETLKKQMAVYSSAETQHEQEVAALKQQLADAQARADKQHTPPALPNKKSEFINGEWINLYQGFGGLDWLVLDVDKQNKRALLLSENIIEKRSYNSAQSSVTWKKCTLQIYLNGVFLDQFSPEDRARIAPVRNENPDNTWGVWSGKRLKTPGGEPTDDTLFLLSVKEVLEYFPGLKPHKDDGDEWHCEADERLVAKCSDGSGAWWWLRSPGLTQDFAAGVHTDGRVRLIGDTVYDDCGGVRPALWLNL